MCIRDRYDRFDKEAPPFRENYSGEELAAFHAQGLIIVPGMDEPRPAGQAADGDARAAELAAIVEHELSAARQRILERIHARGTAAGDTTADAPAEDGTASAEGRPAESPAQTPGNPPAETDVRLPEIFRRFVREQLASDPIVTEAIRLAASKRVEAQIAERRKHRGKGN